jgi:hypothetical protein
MLYPSADTVENVIKMSGYMDKKLQFISAKQVIDLTFGRARHKTKRTGASLNLINAPICGSRRDQPIRPA